MSKPLSKSRFKIGNECPTKLYYSVRKEYGNAKDHDEFLKALAEGGFQVGELAMLYYPGGAKVETLDYEKAIAETNALLERDQVTIYEAAFQFQNLFVRVDILVKKGNSIELTEVKAKSLDSTDSFEPFDKRLLKKGEYRLKADWSDYLLDLAFQTYVIRKAKPHFSVQPGLMLADKSKLATVNGLNQLFLIRRGDDGRVKVELTRQVTKSDLGQQILTRKDLSKDIDLIITKAKMDWADNFEALVQKLSKIMESGERFSPPVAGQCKGCEFKIDLKKFPNGTKSGFQECWSNAKKLKPSDFAREFVFDVWNFRGSEGAIHAGKIFAADLDEEDLNLKEREDDKGGMSRTERQLVQVNFAKGEQKGILFDAQGLAAELKLLKGPFHFIDFETCMAAIPIHAGRRPYEQMAFQFSHHVVDNEGRITHRTEYLDDRKGVFPNFDFVRALKKALEGDDGTVFRFAAHENTVLNQIHRQLEESQENDRDALMVWIETLTTPPKGRDNPWTPKHSFIDMCELTQRYYYLPQTKGSNSIKKLLPAVLNYAGKELESKFPGYITFGEAGVADDPYKKLPPIFSDIPREELEKVENWLIERDELNDGGAAMMAWGRMQFTEMSETERKGLRAALLRYCALDTLAMVMIWEWWQLELRKSGRNAA